jgi:toxin YhaV
MPAGEFATRKGWRLYAHPAFGDVLDRLTSDVEKLAKRTPHSYSAHPKAKLLKRILDLILDEIRSDPNAAEYQLGNTLGPAHRHWRRAKFLGHFRLFFRFSSAHHAIVYAWVNDESTLRKSGSRTDPYAVFEKRLREGNPPDEWQELLRKASGARKKRIGE